MRTNEAIDGTYGSVSIAMKGGTPLLIFILHLLLLAPWLCFVSALPEVYPEVNISSASLTPDKYKRFIASVRDALLIQGLAEESHGIPVLLSEDDMLPSETKYLLVNLENKAGHSITLAMDVTRACITSYRAGNYACFLKRSASPASCHKLPEPSRAMPPPPPEPADCSTGCHLGDLAEDLGGPSWALTDLDKAITWLYLFPTGHARKLEFARGIATCNMMIAGAAMSRYIERRLSIGMRRRGSVADDPSLCGLQASLLDLSAPVQESHQGLFAAPVTVERSNGALLAVDNVRRIIPLLAYLRFHCTMAKALQEEPADAMLIRSVVPADSCGTATCREFEPTARIVGQDGKCVELRTYVPQMPVQLQPCRPNADVNQLWTFKRDGTISSRSSGMCLATSGGTPGYSVIVTKDCRPSPTNHVVWEARDDGAIMSKPSGLVLSSTTIYIPSALVVQTDGRGTG